jgi:hypothetical protein
MTCCTSARAAWALRTAPGIGAALCSITLAFFPITRRVGAWMLGGVAVFGVCTIVLGSTTTFIVALVALFLMGAGDMISVYVRHLLVQYETPDEIRGRVSAVNSVFIGASNELGEFESGITAGWLGLTRAVLFGGAATLGGWLWTCCSRYYRAWTVSRTRIKNEFAPARIIHSRPHLSTAIMLGVAAGPLLPDSWPWLTRLLACWNVLVWSYLP